MFLCAPVIAWVCWFCASTGQPVLNKIKEVFSKKPAKWNVDPAVCLRRRPSTGWRRSGIWGWVGQGHRGDSGLTLGHWFWGQPPSLPFVSPFNLQYAMSNNIPQLWKWIHPCCLTSHLIWYRAEKSDYIQQKRHTWGEVTSFVSDANLFFRFDMVLRVIHVGLCIGYSWKSAFFDSRNNEDNLILKQRGPNLRLSDTWWKITISAHR